MKVNFVCVDSKNGIHYQMCYSRSKVVDENVRFFSIFSRFYARLCPYLLKGWRNGKYEAIPYI